jgi:hypothetical protein
MGAVPKPSKRPSCETCFFRQNMLCALDLNEPCTTFRPADRGLQPERQLSFVFRTERTFSAYAFPQPHQPTGEPVSAR